MHVLISRNLTSNKPLTNFTTIYRKVTENIVNNKYSRNGKKRSEVEQKNVEEPCEEEKAPTVENRKKFSLRGLTRPDVPSLQPVNVISASSRKSFYSSNANYKNLMYNKRTSNFDTPIKYFKSGSSQELHGSGIEQSLKNKSPKLKTFKFIHNRSKSTSKVPPTNVQSMEKSTTSVYNKLSKIAKEKRIPDYDNEETKHDLRHNHVVQIDKKRFKIVYPTHLNKFNLRFFNQRNFSKRKLDSSTATRKFPKVGRKEDQNKSLQDGNTHYLTFRKIQKQEPELAPRPVKTRSVRPDSKNPVHLSKNENTIEFVPAEYTTKPKVKPKIKIENSHLINEHPTLKESDASAKMAINKKYNILLMRKEPMYPPGRQIKAREYRFLNFLSTTLRFKSGVVKPFKHLVDITSENIFNGLPL